MAFTKITNAGFGLTTGTLVGVAASFSSTVSVGGTLTYEDVTNVDSVGLITARNGIEVTDKGVQVGTGATVDSAADNTLTFLTNGSERVRVTSTGDVGVNCTPHSNAGINLHIHGDNTSSEIRLTNTTTGSGANGSILQQSGNTLYLSNTENGNTVFEVNGSERLRITSAGDVGIGDAAPNSNYGTNLSVHSTATDGARLKLSDGTTGKGNTDGLDIISTGGVAYFINRENANMSFSTNDTERLRIDNSGRLLLGTTTEGPSTADDLTIATSGNTGISIRSGTSSAGNIFFSDGTSGDDEIRGVIQYDHASNYMRLYTNATERMRVDEAGRLLINHTADTAPNSYISKLQLCDTSYQGSSLSIRRDGDTSSGPVLLFAKSRSTSKGGNTVIQNNDSIGALYFYGADGTDADTLAGEISVQVDGTPGSNDIPSRMVFATNSGASDRTERLRIDSSGRLLINTTSAITTASGANLQIQATSEAPQIILGRNDSTATTGETLGILSWYGNDGGSYQECASIRAVCDGNHANDDKPTSLQFFVCPDNSATLSQRLRIRTDGLSEFNSSSHVLSATTSVGAGTAKYIYRGHHSSGSTIVFNVWSNGNVESATNSYGAVSDVKLKENIVDANSQWDDLKAIQVRNYNFKESTGQQTHTQLGVVAQEIETVSPGLVSDTTDTDADGNDLGTVTKSVNYSVLYMKAVKALQEAQTRIESLEARLDAGGL